MIIVCIASGPSLTAEDCALVEASGLTTVAVNNSWEMARFCRWIYGGDAQWWASNKDMIDIEAECWTSSQKAADKFGLLRHKKTGAFNSGQRAIEFAMKQGAATVLLLGYDVSTEDGLHWHGPHKTTGNPDAAKCRKWRTQFLKTAEMARKRKVQVINCSRKTTLECFPRMDLETALQKVNR